MYISICIFSKDGRMGLVDPEGRTKRIDGFDCCTILKDFLPTTRVSPKLNRSLFFKSTRIKILT